MKRTMAALTLVLGLGLAGRLTLPDACRLAGLAAAVVVGKTGTATCSRVELLAALRNPFTTTT